MLHPHHIGPQMESLDQIMEEQRQIRKEQQVPVSRNRSEQAMRHQEIMIPAPAQCLCMTGLRTGLARLWTGLAVLLFAVLPAMADDTAGNPVTAADMSAYIEALNVGETAFVQYNPDGSQSSGLFSFRRPWHARIDYSPPNHAIILVAGRRVAVFDLNANTGPAQYPLSRTPFEVFIGRNINLADAEHFRSLETSPEGSRINLALSKSTDESITLNFHNDPLALRGWVYQDAQGNETTMVFDEINEDVSFPQGHFSIEQLRERLFPDS